MVKLRYGHAPSHIRETFCDAIYAFVEWDFREREPTVVLSVNYAPCEITISQACRLVWHCTDVIPGNVYWDLREHIDIGLHTYAACARAMSRAIKLAEV